MAERVEILDIGTKTLKDLRAELKELKTQLEGMVIGSKEYNDTLQEISNKQKELASVTKSSVSDMEGSYNALNKELNELRKAWKATNDEAERASLGEKMAEINTQLKDLDASVGNYQRNVGNYGSALDDLDTKVQSTSQSYDNAIASSNKWVESGDQLQKTMMAMASTMMIAQTAMDMMGIEGEEAEKIMSKLQQVLAITAGFKAIAEGAKGFLQLSKTVKVASLSLNGFKAALISTGVGALVVGIGALIANWEKISSLWNDTSPEEKSEQAIKDLTNATRNLNNELATHNQQSKKDYIAALQKAAGDEKKIQEATTQYEKEQLDLRLKNQKALLDEQIKNERKQYAEYAKLSDKQKKNDDNPIVKAWKDALDMVSDTRTEISNIELDIQRKVTDSLKERTAKYKEYAEQQKEAYNELQDLLAGGNFYKETSLQYERDKDKWKKLLNEKKITQEQYNQAILKLEQDYGKKVQDEQIRLATEEDDKYQQSLDNKKSFTEKKIQEIYNKYQKESELAAREFNSKMVDLSIANDASGMRQLNDSFILSQIESLEKLKEILKQYGDEAKETVFEIEGQISSLKDEKKLTDNENKVANEEERTASILELSDILITTADRVNSAWADVFATIETGFLDMSKELKSSEKGWNKYGKVASIGIGVASDMLGSLADMQDTQTKEGFEKNKKLQIASATMAMLGGIINVWQSAMSKENSWMTIWGQLAAGTSLSAMILATGLAQINQIKSTSFEGGGGAAATPSMTALSAIQNPVETVTNIEGASAESDVNDTRVYVLESDIYNTSKKVNVTQSEATF